MKKERNDSSDLRLEDFIPLYGLHQYDKRNHVPEDLLKENRATGLSSSNSFILRAYNVALAFSLGVILIDYLK